ncbi:MAG: lipopolysaccharide biosynthesis protein [Verrucomicrobia bacterium]|nr:lipopolysaccharide biosynthesis protein [Verrucomicrobiota bacterium]
MLQKSNDPSGRAEQDGSSGKDLTGRTGLVRSVLFSWGSQFVFIAAGFIMPRMIDDFLGQEVLGVWDFSWSLLGYFYFVQAGIASAVNRYVGKYWATQDIVGINRIVSCATFVLFLAGLIVFGLALGSSALLPWIAGGKLGANNVILLLGASLSIQTALGASVGVITGCHRWELQNMNQAAWHIATVAGMVVVLLLGGGLLQMALVTFMGDVLGQTSRVIMAFRICPGLRLQKNLVEARTIRDLYAFGGKTLLPTVSDMLVNSTTSMLIVSYLGPASLALFTRPRSLIRHADTLVRRMAMTLIPTVSSLEAAGDVQAIRNLLIKSVRYTLYLVLPIVLVLSFFGGPVLQLWMGPGYGNDLLMAVLAIGFLIPMAQSPVLHILAGLNAHGRAGAAELIAGIATMSLVIVALKPLQSGIMGVAIGVTLPITLMSGIYYTRLICKRVDMPVRHYLPSVAVAPVVHLLPFLVLLAGARWVFRSAPLHGLMWSAILGAPLLATLYWKFVLPGRMKGWILKKLRRNTGAILIPKSTAP